MNRNRLILLLATALALLAAGCGAEHAVSLGPVANTTDTTTFVTTGTEVQTTGWTIWLVHNDGLVPILRTTTEVSLTPARSSIDALLAGPTAQERAAGLSSAIPKGTKLLGIALHDGVATIDLTSEYATGGGALSMQDRLGQIVYTLTEFPTIKKVLFHLDGAPVHVFSTEGIVLDHAVGRSDYVNLLPAIIVNNPTRGQVIKSGHTVSGSANVFEANVTIEVLNARGRVLGKTVTLATCGTGCRGTFSARIKFHVVNRQPGTIVVHDDDAAGTGSPPHVVRIPVTLAPSLIHLVS